MAVERSRWQNAREILVTQGISGIVEELRARLRHRWGDPTSKVPYHEFRTADWDRRRGVQTEGVMLQTTFDHTLPNVEYGQPYIPTTIWSFRQIMGALRRAGIRTREFTLIDYGCGKGRAVILAIESGFRAAIGVEFEPTLAKLASENFQTYRGRKREFLVLNHADATTVPVPSGPTVVFLYNPFDGPVLESVADNIRGSFAADPRPMYVVYHTARPGSPFARGTPFLLLESTPNHEIYRLVSQNAEFEDRR
jgi:SAM-dependent methyltransferase